jgi:hypothetical protein
VDGKADAEAVRIFYERLASGEEEMLPAEMVDRILDGESKVKIWREHRRLSLRDLAEGAGNQRRVPFAD